MKIVIDIPEEIYKDIMIHNREMRGSGKSAYYFEGLIQNGTPLPKGHGRLIDADALLEHSDGGDWNGVCYDPEYVKTRYIYKAPTIIEADKERL